MCIFPVNIDGIRYATAQLIAKRDGKIYLEQIAGIPTVIALQNGKVLRGLKAKGADTPIYRNIYLLSSQEAERLFLSSSPNEVVPEVTVTLKKEKEAGPLRTITMGVNKAAEEPSDEDFENSAVYRIDISGNFSENEKQLLRIDYRGDVARLYADGKLIDDNFYNGRPFVYGLWRLPAGCASL